MYGLILEIVEYITGGLLDVFSMNMEYFTQAVPIANDIFNIILASAWALLLGNLVFQAAKSMMSGLGLEGESPAQLFARTFLFGFMLLASRQICEIGLGLSGVIIEMLQIPDAVTISLPGENLFGIAASWLLMIIVGLVLMWQVVKLFFTVGERYFLVGFLTIAAPWAFAMGGSRSTSDIFKGWARMFATMCLMMILNVIFLKILLSALGNMTDDGGIIAWLIFVIAICRVARKADTMIMRVGLNPVPAGDGLGRGILGSTASYLVMRTVASGVTKTIGSVAGAKAKSATGGTPPPTSGSASASTGRNTASNTSNASNRGGTSQTTASAQNTTSQNSNNTSQGNATSVNNGTAGMNNTAQPAANSAHNAGAATVQSSDRQYYGSHGTAGRNSTSVHQNHAATQNSSRKTSVSNPNMGHGTHGSAFRPGMAGTAGVSPVPGKDTNSTIKSGSQRPFGTAGTRSGADSAIKSRYSAVPQSSRFGTAGTARSALTRQGGTNINASSRADIRHDANNITNENVNHTTGALRAESANQIPRGTHGNSSTSKMRKSPVLADSSESGLNRHSRNAVSGQAGTQFNVHRDVGNASARTAPNTQSVSRHGRNAAQSSQSTQGTNDSARHSRNISPRESADFRGERKNGGMSETSRTHGGERYGARSDETRPLSAKRPPIQKAQDVAKRSSVNLGTRKLDGTNGNIRGSVTSGENRKSQLKEKGNEDE